MNFWVKSMKKNEKSIRPCKKNSSNVIFHGFLKKRFSDIFNYLSTILKIIGRFSDHNKSIIKNHNLPFDILQLLVIGIKYNYDYLIIQLSISILVLFYIFTFFYLT